MKLLVVGHLCLDVIHPVDAPEIESYGGIYYAVATLASLLDADGTVVPVFGVNRADYPTVVGDLSRFPNVDLSGIFKFDEPTNRVHLYYKDSQTRVECSKDIATPIPYERIRRHLSADGILINMISGFDITLETLDRIRMAVRSHGIPIHFDFHSLTLGVQESHERFRRPIPEWRRWVFMTDTVQLNEEEIGGLSVERLTEEQTVGHLLTLGVKGVLLTRGERGASVYLNDRKRVVRTDVPPVAIGEVADTTGCGDVFGAAFQYRYVKTGDLVSSAEFANRVAAAKTRLRGVERLHMLKEDLLSG